MRQSAGDVRRSSARVAWWIVAVVGSAFGQVPTLTPVLTIAGPTGGSYYSLGACPGDTTGDGFPDLLAWGSGAYAGDLPNFEVRSGADASLVLVATPGIAGMLTFASLADRIGDVNGDGVADVGLTGAGSAFGNPNGARIYSGSNAALLLSVSAPSTSRMFGVGDFNLDGTVDFALGLHGAIGLSPSGVCQTSPGNLTVKSGATGATLFSETTGARPFANDVAALGDAGGGPGDDFAFATSGAAGTSSIFYCPAPGGSPATVKVIEGGTSATLWTFSYSYPNPALSPPTTFFGGDIFVDGGGDADFDGRGDLFIAWKPPVPSFPPLPSPLHLEVRSVVTGQVVSSAVLAPSYERLHGIATLGDVDGDGRPDFVVGNRLSVDVYSTATMTLLASVPAPTPGSAPNGGFGLLSAVGDLTGDGVSEFAVTAFNVGGRNEIRVYSPTGLPAAALAPLSAACGAVPLVLSATPPTFGQTWYANLSGGPPFAPAIVVATDYPAAPISLPSGPGAFCPVHLDLASLLVLDTPTLDAAGGSSYPIDQPPTLPLLGRSFTLNAACLVGGNLSFSNGLVGTWGY